MEEGLKKEVLKLIEEYERLSDFIEDEVPLHISEDIRPQLYWKGYLDELFLKIKYL